MSKLLKYQDNNSATFDGFIGIDKSNWKKLKHIWIGNYVNWILITHPITVFNFTSIFSIHENLQFHIKFINKQLIKDVKNIMAERFPFKTNL